MPPELFSGRMDMAPTTLVFIVFSVLMDELMRQYFPKSSDANLSTSISHLWNNSQGVYSFPARRFWLTLFSQYATTSPMRKIGISHFVALIFDRTGSFRVLIALST